METKGGGGIVPMHRRWMATIGPRGEDSASDIILYLNNLAHGMRFLYIETV